MFSNFLKKGLEIIVPKTADPIGDFKKACTHVIGILKKEETEEISSLNDSLNLIQESLIEELESNDMIYFDHISQTSFLSNLVKAISQKTLLKVHVDPILNFFMAFLSSRLNHYFAQINVHQSFALLLTKLDIFYHKNPEITMKFVTNIWQLSQKSPLILELTSLTDKNNNLSYPLFDFFCSSITQQGSIGSIARDVILSLFSQTNEGKINIEPHFKEYVAKHIFPNIIEQISILMDVLISVQFRGTVSLFLEWTDQLLTRYGDYDMKILFEKLESLPDTKQILALSFFLSYFTCHSLLSPAIEIAKTEKIQNLIIKGLQSYEDNISIHSTFSLLNAMLSRDELVSFIMPIDCKTKSDVLSILPPEWLTHLEGRFSFESYEEDAISRILMHKRCESGKNDIFYKLLLDLLKKFKILELKTAVSLTGLISTFFSINPLLINNELAESFELAVKDFIYVEKLPELKETTEDSPEVRAVILAEFGKEIHSTYLASEKLAANEELFVDDI